eukprot:scaffold14998_cov17-Tisochrysis_lutea.AAC.1
MHLGQSHPCAPGRKLQTSDEQDVCGWPAGEGPWGSCAPWQGSSDSRLASTLKGSPPDSGGSGCGNIVQVWAGPPSNGAAAAAAEAGSAIGAVAGCKRGA